MTNKIRFALAVVALLACGSASAMTVNWGTITAPDARDFGNSFNANSPEGPFTDSYNFTLTSGVNSFGGIIQLDPLLNQTDIDHLSLSLWSGGSSLHSIDVPWPYIPQFFDFSNLGAGDYSLQISGSIDVHRWGTDDSAGYYGAIAFTPGDTAVPEPSTLALMGLGLLGIAFAMRRRLFN
jgi:PEP-CTERM motif-containing protein